VSAGAHATAPSRQRRRFLADEGDAFFERNRVDEAGLAARVDADPVLRALRELAVRPQCVLEVGAGDGWRLRALRESGGAEPPAVFGLDPSRRALVHGRRRFGLDLARATAERLPFADGTFDLVVLGFCLYLCDRRDLFRVAAEVDRVTAERGLVVVFDFHAATPHRVPYAHAPGQWSYKMDHGALFAWSPAYQLVLRELSPYPGAPPPAEGGEQLQVDVFRRDTAAGWPEPPAPARRGERA